MCFLEYWTGSSVKKCHKSNEKVNKISVIEKESIIENNFKAVAIHKRENLLDETIKLINSHWPKSRSERLTILGTSKDSRLPLSLILVVKRQDSENEIMHQLFGNKNSISKKIRVFGHLRLVPVPAHRKACFIESMIIHHEMRGKGLGTFFISQAEQFCEDVLHLKSIFLSTYDSGEFYLKIGFELTPAICVYGHGEVNTVSKKIYLKKKLNYVEPEIIQEVPEEIYDPTKDHNYKQQRKIEHDVILSGFPYLLEQPRSIVTKLCQLLNFPSDVIRYYYSFETVSRRTGEKKSHLIISNKTVEAKICLLDMLEVYGILSFQDVSNYILDDEEITIITHELRYTSWNYVFKKELVQMKAEELIFDFKYENYQFHAKQTAEDDWIIVKDMDIVKYLKTPIPEIPDEPDEIDLWGDESEVDSLENKLNSLKQHFKSQAADDDWINRFRRPSQILLEPLETTYYITKRKPLFEFKMSIDEDDTKDLKDTKEEKIEKNIELTKTKKPSTSTYDAITLGLNIDELF